MTFEEQFNKQMMKNRGINKSSEISEFIRIATEINEILGDIIENLSFDEYELSSLCEYAGNELSDILIVLNDPTIYKKLRWIGYNNPKTEDLRKLIDELDDKYHEVCEEVDRLYGVNHTASGMLKTKKGSLFRALREITKRFED